MVDELRSALGDAVILRRELLVTAPDPLGLQHDERERVLDMQPSWLRRWSSGMLTWRRAAREIDQQAVLDPSVLVRLASPAVPQMGDVRPYRPRSLADHVLARDRYRDVAAGSN